MLPPLLSLHIPKLVWCALTKGLSQCVRLSFSKLKFWEIHLVFALHSLWLMCDCLDRGAARAVCEPTALRSEFGKFSVQGPEQPLFQGAEAAWSWQDVLGRGSTARPITGRQLMNLWCIIHFSFIKHCCSRKKPAGWRAASDVKAEGKWTPPCPFPLCWVKPG